MIAILTLKRLRRHGLYNQGVGGANAPQCFFGELLEKLVIYNTKTV